MLVDTDVFSYVMKAGDKRGEVYAPHLAKKLVTVSFVTVGELLFGAYKKHWSSERLADLTARLRAVVITPYDIEVCKTYADIKAKLEAAGNTLQDNDLWIAACAIRHSIPLISNNRSHFEKVPGLVLISEATVIAEIKSQATLKLEEGKPISASSSGSEPPASQ